jgi:hypothetical protein
MGNETPASASIDAHSHLYCKNIDIIQYNHGSAMVETKINQRKNNEKDELSIKPSNAPPASLAVEILSNRQQTGTSNSHRLPLIRREKARPKLDPVDRQPDNLQKVKALGPVKNNIIPTIPHRPA